MKKIRVGVAGYGTIGQRLADGVAFQEDMELVGIADLAPTLSLQALRENDMIGANGVEYKLYLVEGADPAAFAAMDIPVAGSFEDLCRSVDIMLDSSPAGVGAKNKAIYTKLGVKAIFQGGEKNDVADVFFHGYANYEQGLGQDHLKLTSCNTTGLIRSVDCLDRAFGIEKVAITIIRRVADPGDYHRGLTNALQMEKAPSHQALDLMTIMPHVDATGILVHTPVTHGHIITVLATDIPLSERQLRRLCRRALVGLSRTGSMGGNGSGEIVLAFTTANRVPHDSETAILPLQMLHDDAINPLFRAVAECVEESVLSSLLHAETVTGNHGRTVQCLTELLNQ